MRRQSQSRREMDPGNPSQPIPKNPSQPRSPKNPSRVSRRPMPSTRRSPPGTANTRVIRLTPNSFLSRRPHDPEPRVESHASPAISPRRPRARATVTLLLLARGRRSRACDLPAMASVTSSRRPPSRTHVRDARRPSPDGTHHRAGECRRPQRDATTWRPGPADREADDGGSGEGPHVHNADSEPRSARHAADDDRNDPPAPAASDHTLPVHRHLRSGLTPLERPRLRCASLRPSSVRRMRGGDRDAARRSRRHLARRSERAALALSAWARAHGSPSISPPRLPTPRPECRRSGQARPAARHRAPTHAPAPTKARSAQRSREP